MLYSILTELIQSHHNPIHESKILDDGTIPLFVTPTRLHGIGAADRSGTLDTVEYGRPLELTLPSGAERGLLIHRALELLGQKVTPEKARDLAGPGITDEDWGKLNAIY